MHYFLSGTSGVGKSTIIQKVLAAYSGKVGGFCTRFDAPRGQMRKELYLMPAQYAQMGDPSRTPSEWMGAGCQVSALSKTGHLVAVCTPQGPASVYPAQFNTAAREYLAADCATLIIMDECGRLERDAQVFQNIVLERLAGDIPVLGVLCYKPSDFTRTIAAHPNVTVLAITPENRDAIAAQLVAAFTAQP